MRIYLYLLLIGLHLVSCNETKPGELWRIPVDIDMNNPLAVSEIMEDITAIELELTGKSYAN